MVVCTNSCSIKPFQLIALIRYQNYIPLDDIQFSDSIYGLKTHYSLSNPSPQGGTSMCGLYRYVWPQRVWFFSCFGHK